MHTPEAMRGRVFAAFDMVWQLGRLVSLLMGALIAAVVGIQAVYYPGGAVLLLFALGGRAAHAYDTGRLAPGLVCFPPSTPHRRP